jgi:hypothetical protein
MEAEYEEQSAAAARATRITDLASAEREVRIVELAGVQHGVVSRQQLLALGLARRSIARPVRQRRLRPLHRGMYLVGPLTAQWTWEMAALLGVRCAHGAESLERSARGRTVVAGRDGMRHGARHRAAEWKRQAAWRARAPVGGSACERGPHDTCYAGHHDRAHPVRPGCTPGPRRRDAASRADGCGRPRPPAHVGGRAIRGAGSARIAPGCGSAATGPGRPPRPCPGTFGSGRAAAAAGPLCRPAG